MISVPSGEVLASGDQHDFSLGSGLQHRAVALSRLPQGKFAPNHGSKKSGFQPGPGSLMNLGHLVGRSIEQGHAADVRVCRHSRPGVKLQASPIADHHDPAVGGQKFQIGLQVYIGQHLQNQGRALTVGQLTDLRLIALGGVIESLMRPVGPHKIQALGTAGGPDHSQSIGTPPLQCRQSHPTAGAVNQHPFTRPSLTALKQGSISRRIRHIESGTLSKIHTIGQPLNLLFGTQSLLRIGPAERTRQVDALSHLPTTRSRGTDHSGGIASRNVGQRSLPVEPTSNVGVDGVDTDRLELHHHLARPRRGVGHLLYLQDLGSTELFDLNGLHLPVLASQGLCPCCSNDLTVIGPHGWCGRHGVPAGRPGGKQEQAAMSVVGTSVPRKEVHDKLTGRAKYLDDLKLPGMLHGVTVRSPIARGRLKSVHYPEGIPWHEFTIVTAADIPGANVVKLILEDQPILAGPQINHPEEPLLLLAHPDRFMAEEGRRRIQLEFEEQEPLFDMLASARQERVIWGQDNILKKIDILKGDVDSVWDQAATIVEGEYWTGASEQLYIENNGMMAQVQEDGSITVWGSMQCPYYVLPAVCHALGRTPETVQIVQCETGGGFGGKEEYPSIIACHAALLALKSGKPVKLVYDREEDMASTTKRHPSYTRHRTALDKEGKFLAMDIEFILDGGAYATLSSVVLSRGSIHSTGPYYVPNVRIKARAVATNHPPHGAYRGFGNPQSLFAVERHLDKVAAAVGLEPDELRRRNFLRDGLTTATGQIVRDGVDLEALMERAFEASDYRARRKRFAAENPTAAIKKGIGFSVFHHGSGFTGIGETKMASIAGCEATPQGKVRVLAASTEIGQGSRTIFSQIVADALQLPYEMIEVAQPDTRQVPNSGPTVASRTSMVVGKLVETSALGVKQALVQQAGLSVPYTGQEFSQAIQRYLQRYPDLKVYSQYHTPPTIKWNEETYQGDAYGAYGWAVYVAEVSYDPITYEARVDHFVALQDVGKVLHPILAEGQVEGGVAQGVGWAISEEVVWKDGRMINNQMTNYIMPTSVDLPLIKVLFHEAAYAGGPQGAKGVGEMPIDGPAPAILNALSWALNKNFDRVPATPEIIMKTVESSGAN